MEAPPAAGATTPVHSTQPRRFARTRSSALHDTVPFIEKYLTKRVSTLAEGLNGLLQFCHVFVPVSSSTTACAGGTPRFFR